MSDLEFDLGDGDGFFLELGQRIRAAPPLDLDAYRALVESLPRPTERQIAAFVDHVCEARSWHKRLPFFVPGVEFCFYLDPNKGTRYVFREDGITGLEEDPSRRADIDAYGHLVYFAGALNSLDDFDFVSEHTLDAQVPAILVDGHFRHLPEEIHTICRVELTSVIEQMTGRLPTLARILERTPVESRRWPQTSGGAATVAALVDAITAGTENTGAGHASELDRGALEANIAALLEPERARLRAGMRDAIDSLLMLLRN